MYRTAPGPTDSEQVLVNDGAVLLVGGDDKGQDTAVHQELHAEGFVLREKIVFNDGLQNWFVGYVLLSKVNQSSSCLSQAITPQQNMFNIFRYLKILAGLKKTEAFLVR